MENTPSPTALNDAPQENEDKKDEDEDENKQDVNINKKVIAKDELGKDVTGTEYEDGTYVVSGTGDMYNFSLINGDVCFTKGKEQIIRRALRNVKKIIVANGVKSIGSMSFYDATAMTEIEISDTVTKIGDYAFMNCVNVKNITIPKGVVEIGRQAFKKCINLSGVTVAYDVQKIGEYAFEDCNNLTSVIFFEGLKKIGEYAFKNCSSLMNIYIPSSVDMIGKNVFSGCVSLKEIEVDENNNTYSSDKGSLYNKNKSLIIKVPQKYSGDFVIPSTVKNIESYCFECCNDITNITIPNGITWSDD